VWLFGVVYESLPEPLEVFMRREDAEVVVAELLADEPEWEALLRIEEIELPDPCWN